jgi:tartrate-resistant acid phosphatase type 5
MVGAGRHTVEFLTNLNVLHFAKEFPMILSKICRPLALALAGCVALGGIASAKTEKPNAGAAAQAVSKKEKTGDRERGLQFSVLGDWGWNGKRNQTEVAKVMAAKGVGSFIISAGDNFQVVGVRSVQDPLWMLNFESVFSDPALECDWYVALGNHDYKGEVQAEIDYSKISRRWNMPSRYFAVHKRINDTTAVDFYIIDTSPFQTAYYKTDEHHVLGQDTAKQMRWIDSCLTNSKSRWKIVVGHHPVYSSGSAHGKETGDMEARFARFFEDKGVDAYFCGHDHDFEYLKPQGGRVNYFVCGTVEVRPMSAPLASTVFAKSAPGYTKVSLNHDAMQVVMIDTAGAEVYKTKITKK